MLETQSLLAILNLCMKNKEKTMDISSKNRAKLRAVASTIQATSIVGINGITDNLVEQIKMDFNSRELVKIKVLASSGLSPKECMEELSVKTKSIPVCTIGNYFVLYKINNKKGFKHVLSVEE